MATTTFLSNATVNITQGATNYDVSDQCTAATLTVGFEDILIIGEHRATFIAIADAISSSAIAERSNSSSSRFL